MLAEALGKKLPSGYEVHEHKMLTFHNLEETGNAFAGIYDPGTLTPLTSMSTSGSKSITRRVAKSLLRFALQEQLHRHKVRWQHEEGCSSFS